MNEVNYIFFSLLDILQNTDIIQCVTRSVRHALARYYNVLLLFTSDRILLKGILPLVAKKSHYSYLFYTMPECRKLEHIGYSGSSKQYIFS